MENIAVIIPTYNRVETTIRAVQSALNQTLAPDEIIVVDDGSNPAVLLELENQIFGINNKSIKLIKSEATRHPGLARNIGLNSTNSKWIAFLDSDDSWHQEKLEIQLKEMKQHNSFASCTMTSSQDPEIEYRNAKKYSYLSTRDLLKTNSVVNSSVVVSRELLLSVGGVTSEYSVRGAEDYATWLRISSKTKWLYLRSALVNYTEDSDDSIRKVSFEASALNVSYAQLNYLIWKAKSPFGLGVVRCVRYIIRFIVKIAA